MCFRYTRRYYRRGEAFVKELMLISITAIAETSVKQNHGANASPLHRSIGIFSILHPIARVVENVLPNGIQFLVVANNVLIIITLPHQLAGRFPHLIDAPSCDRFEIPDDRAE